MSGISRRSLASPKANDADAPAAKRESAYLIALAVLAFVSWIAYLRIARLSPLFDYYAPTEARPIVQVLLLLALSFICYLGAIWLIQRVPGDWRMWSTLVGGAGIFSVTLLASTPIQEVDIYRYIWDGAVVSQGVSPFRFSPKLVNCARAEDESLPEDLRSLAAYRDDHSAMAETLSRVHFSELPTVYPPTSQAVFAAAHLSTPETASLSTHLTFMKAWFFAFDLATFGLVVLLLHLARQPLGLSLTYAWCPLLVKEVANSGHLDSVAFCLTTLSIAVAAWLIFRKQGDSKEDDVPSWSRDSLMSAVALTILALAVGAKLYPMILAPIMLLTLARVLIHRHGWARAVASASLAAIAFVGVCWGTLWPMLPGNEVRPDRPAAHVDEFPRDPFLPPLPSVEGGNSNVDTQAQDASQGIKTFLRQWEMNDFLFLIVVENLKPTDEMQPGQEAWFSFVPNAVRHSTVSWGEITLGGQREHVPFALTRAATGVVFMFLAGWFAWRASNSADARDWFHYLFLTIAWFWLLAPTQNPWYWTWALPLLPFARAKSWLLVSGLCLVYYLRFWLDCHWADTTVWGTRYVGFQFFDFVVTWLEFLPFFLILTVESLWRWVAQKRQEDAAGAQSTPTAVGDKAWAA